MSDRLAGKIKENAGKTKYSSLNLNQTYKGTKVETKTTTGTARHGLQSLGKIGSSRRIPPPANLPSLKSENSGNDPTVSLVPSGGGGWGSAKEKTETAQTATPPPQQNPGQAQGNVPAPQQPLLQPQRPTAPSSYPTQQPTLPPSTQQQPTQSQNAGPSQPSSHQEKSEVQAKTWGNVSSSEAGGQVRPSSHQQSPYFNREFPSLAGGSTGDVKADGKEPAHAHPGMVRNTHEPPWMERSGPGPPPPHDYGYGREHYEMYNGGPGPGPQFRRPPQDYQYNRGHPQNYPQHYSNGTIPGPGGRPPQRGYPDSYVRPPMPRQGQRPGPVQGAGTRPGDKRMEGETDDSKTSRPALLRPEDIQAMDDDEDDGGWAGAQGEVDYTAKLNFEDVDEEDKEDPDKENRKDGRRIEEKDRRREREPPIEGKREPEGPSQQLSRSVQEPSHPPQQPKSAWGEPPPHPSYIDGQRGPHGGRPIPPQMGRPYDSRGSPPGPGYGQPPAPWNMQYLPPQQGAPQRMLPGQYPPPGRGLPPSQHRGDTGGPLPPKDEKPKEWSEQCQKQQEEMHAAIERARKRREEEEIRLQSERKAAAMVKLKALDEKQKAREVDGNADQQQDKEDAIMREKHTSEYRDSEQKERELIVKRDEREQKEREWEREERDNQMPLADYNRPMVPRLDATRPRNDSDSSDNSRSSGSRSYYHRQSNIPPRFQQQRQQQHQQYQQQQQYQASRPPPQTQLAPQQPPREYAVDVAPPMVRPPPVVDSGPASPTHPVPLTHGGETAPPVRRIMKRSESSSTGGDDIASIKSLEGSGEKEKERTGSVTRPRQDSRSGSVSEQESKSKAEEKKEIPGASEQKRDYVFEAEQKNGKRNLKNEKEGRRDDRRDERRPRDERKDSNKDEKQRRDRREQKTAWKTIEKVDDTSKEQSSERKPEANKRKIEEGDDYDDEHQHKKRERDRDRQNEGPARARGGFPVKGRGRGMSGIRGRSDYRTPGRDNRMKPRQDTRPPPAKKNNEEVEEDATKLEAPKKDTDRTPKESSKERPERTSEKPQSRKEDRPERSERYEKERPEREKMDKDRRERPERYDRSDKERDFARKERTDKKWERYHDRREDNWEREPRENKERGTRENRDREPRDVRERQPRDNKGKPRTSDNRKGEWSKENRKDETQRRPSGKENKEHEDRDQRHPRDRDRYQDRYRDRDQDRERDRDRDRDRDRVTDKDRPKEKERDQDPEKEKEREKQPMRESDRKDYRVRQGRESNHANSRDKPGFRTYPTRGRGGVSGRGSRRGGISHRGRVVGSGRFNSGSNYRQQKYDEVSSEDEGSETDSSSYTTATSASEERSDDDYESIKPEQEEKPKEKQSRGGYTQGRVMRGGASGRGIRGTGRGGFGRQRREQEKPPRFQKQQERAALQRGLGRGRSRGTGRDGRDSNWTRGRGRGRGRGGNAPNSIEQSDEGTTLGVPATEDWEEEVEETRPSDKGEKKDIKKGGFPSKGSSGQRGSRDDSSRSGPRRDGPRNNQRKGDHFLAEKQQARADGSRVSAREPKGAVPAAKNVESAATKSAGGQQKVEKRGDYSGVDVIAGDAKTPKRDDQALKKANITQFDLHNIAGVICIDDFTDDDSDISSTLSGFVEVTSKRAQKELKEKQREEEERRRRNEEKATQRGADGKFKKNQAAKPPRFSKQHQTSPTPMVQTKPAGTVGKYPLGVAVEGATVIPSGGLGSNASSTNSTKRNSPVTVERGLSPPPPPVFNAWNKPLTLVTPAKPPSAAMMLASNVPDPLAVGSGKPIRQHPASVLTAMQNSLMNSNFDDKSAEDELKEMTKEIESMACTEEHDETATLQEQSVSRGKETKDGAHGKGSSKHLDAEKKQQPKPQRERAPRFERGSKRKTAAEDEAKKEAAQRVREKDEVSQKKEKTSTKSDDSDKVSPISKAEDLVSPADTTGQRPEPGEMLSEVSEETISKEKPNDEQSEQKDEKDDAKPRKDSDYSIKSDGRSNEDGSLFDAGTLSVDIPETSAERPPTPVSPTMFEMNRRMNAARKAWNDVPAPSVALPSVSVPSPSAWEDAIRTPTSGTSTRVGMCSADSDSGGVTEDGSSSAAEKRDISDTKVSKAEVSKSSESQVLNKKPGPIEQQNVCKVKPQQQQRPLESQLPITSQAEEMPQPELETVAIPQPVLTQDHILQQTIHPYQYHLDGQLVQLHQRQPQAFLQQPLQQAQAQQVAASSYQLPTQIQQVRQPTSAPSPLSQPAPELFQSPFLTGNLYSASAFQGSQSFMSIPIVATTATQSYVTATSRTQAPSVMTVQGQQNKAASGSVFAPTMAASAQPMYMPFDPQNMGGTTTLFGFSQPPQAGQRQLIGSHQMGFADAITQQSSLQSAQQQSQAAVQQFQQRPFGFQPSVNQAGGTQKGSEDRTTDLNRASSSDTSMLKHINAKPFEPPKRLSTPTSSLPSASSSVGMNFTSGVNPNMVSIRPSPPHVGTLSQSPPMTTFNLSSRPVSMSPVDPNHPFPTAVGSFVKPAPIGHFQVPQQQQQPVIQQFTPFQQQQVHIKPQQLQHQLQVRPQAQQQTTQQQLQQQSMAHMQAAGNPRMPQAMIQAVHRQFGPVGTIGAGHAAIGNPRFPGPIQRPPTAGAPGMAQVVPQGQPRPIQPPRPSRPPSQRMAHTKTQLISARPQVPSATPIPQGGTSFKALQHQKMMEQTREFFNQELSSKPGVPKQLPSQQLQEKQLQIQHQLQLQQQLHHQHQMQQQQQGALIQQPPKPQQQQQQQVQMPRQQPQQIQKHQAVQLQQQAQKMPQGQPQLAKQPMPIAPTSGAHHQNKPPRLVAQENKTKQINQAKQDKKEDARSHIIELPKRKPSDNVSKTKPAKFDSSKQDDTQGPKSSNGKGAANKRGSGGPIRIAPMPQRAPPGNGRSRPNRGRPQSKQTSSNAAATGSKTKAETSNASVTTGGATTTTSKPGKEAAVSSKSQSSIQEANDKKTEQAGKAPDSVSVNS